MGLLHSMERCMCRAAMAPRVGPFVQKIATLVLLTNLNYPFPWRFLTSESVLIRNFLMMSLQCYVHDPKS